jgi:hypothetical protein
MTEGFQLNAGARDVSKSGLRPLLWIAFLSLPSLLAFSASAVLSQQGPYPASALWFLYVVSRLFGYMGMVIAASLTIGIGIRRSAFRISAVFDPHEFIPVAGWTTSLCFRTDQPEIITLS